MAWGEGCVPVEPAPLRKGPKAKTAIRITTMITTSPMIVERPIGKLRHCFPLNVVPAALFPEFIQGLQRIPQWSRRRQKSRPGFPERLLDQADFLEIRA